MAEQVQSTEETPTADVPATPPPPPKRSLGHRGADPRDTAAELAARAHQISLEAGSKMAGAMRDLIHAAAGISGFVVETARDVTQFMVRRGQLAQDEAERLIREAEEAYSQRVAAGYVPSGASAARGSDAAAATRAAPSGGEERPSPPARGEPAALASSAPAPPPAPATLATTANEPETVVADEVPAIAEPEPPAAETAAGTGALRADLPAASEKVEPARRNGTKSEPVRAAKETTKPPAREAGAAKGAKSAARPSAAKGSPARPLPTKDASVRSGAAVKTATKAAAKASPKGGAKSAARTPAAKLPAKAAAKSAPAAKKAAAKKR
jgi:hypothetical protein